VYCSPGTQVVDLFPKGRYVLEFCELSAVMRLDYHYAMGSWTSPPFSATKQAGDAVIPADDLLRVLQGAGIA
jgi:hypothetical protein